MRRLLISAVVLGLMAGGVFAGAQSGLGEGEKIQAFLVKNCEGGDPYCQVCKYGQRPKLITVGELSDPAWIQDLVAIQTLHEKYSDQGAGLAVFGLAASFENGHAVPVSDPDQALAQLKKIKEENQLTFPLVIAQNADEIYKAQNKANPGYKVFEKYYNVSEGRTVIFGDSGNTVRFSAVFAGDSGGDELGRLEETVKANL